MKLLALLSAFDLSLLLEHVLGWLLARTFSCSNVVPHAALGHGAILAFKHFGFHGLLAFLGHSSLRKGNRHRLFATLHHWCFLWAFGVAACMERSSFIFAHCLCYFGLFCGFGLWCLHFDIISCFCYLCNATSYEKGCWVSLGHSSSRP